jgi:predicted metal-dependent peptidase
MEENHPHRPLDYQTVSLLIQLEQPSLLTRDYTNNREYEQTIAAIFNSAIEGIYTGKINKIAQRKLHADLSGKSLSGRIFLKRNLAKKAVSQGQIRSRIDYFNSLGNHNLPQDNIDSERVRNLALRDSA